MRLLMFILAWRFQIFVPELNWERFYLFKENLAHKSLRFSALKRNFVQIKIQMAVLNGIIPIKKSVEYCTKEGDR